MTRAVTAQVEQTVSAVPSLKLAVIVAASRSHDWHMLAPCPCLRLTLHPYSERRQGASDTWPPDSERGGPRSLHPPIAQIGTAWGYGAFMASVGSFLLLAVIFGVYLAVILATLDGAVRAIRERYMPPWVVGLVAVALLTWFHELLGAPLRNWGGLLAVAGGIVAGAAYGLRRRRVTPEHPSA